MAESDTNVLPDDAVISGSLNGEETQDGERPDPTQAVEDARRQVDQERAGRLAAEKRAAEAESTARTSVASAHEQAIEAKIGGYESRVNEARAARRAARDAGDPDAEDTADAALQDALADKKLAERERDWLKGQRETAAKQPQRENDGPQITPAAKQWIDAHPRFNTDQEYHTEALAAHHRWVAQGKSVDTPEYFAFVESRLAREFPDTTSTPRPAVTQTRRPASSTAASPARGGDGGGARTTQLTESDIARALGVEVSDLKTAADWNGMKYDAYLKDQAEIIAAKRDGRPTGLFGGGDGATYR